MNPGIAARLNAELHASISKIVSIRDTADSESLQYEAAKYLIKMAPDGPEKQQALSRGAAIALNISEKSFRNMITSVRDVEAYEALDLLPDTPDELETEGILNEWEAEDAGDEGYPRSCAMEAEDDERLEADCGATDPEGDDGQGDAEPRPHGRKRPKNGRERYLARYPGPPSVYSTDD